MPSKSTQSEMCIRCAAECCDPFLHSVCFFTFVMCHSVSERARKETQRTTVTTGRSRNVVWMCREGGETVTRSARVCLCWSETMCWIIGSIIGVYFYIFSESFWLLFFLPPLLFLIFYFCFFPCLVILYRKQSMLSSPSTWCVGSESGVST